MRAYLTIRQDDAPMMALYVAVRATAAQCGEYYTDTGALAPVYGTEDEVGPAGYWAGAPAAPLAWGYMSCAGNYMDARPGEPGEVDIIFAGTRGCLRDHPVFRALGDLFAAAAEGALEVETSRPDVPWREQCAPSAWTL